MFSAMYCIMIVEFDRQEKRIHSLEQIVVYSDDTLQHEKEQRKIEAILDEIETFRKEHEIMKARVFQSNGVIETLYGGAGK